MELLEVSGESGGQSDPFLANGRAHGERSTRGHGAGAGHHPEETGGAMMELIGGYWDASVCRVGVSCAVTAKEWLDSELFQ